MASSVEYVLKTHPQPIKMRAIQFLKLITNDELDQNEPEDQAHQSCIVNDIAFEQI